MDAGDGPGSTSRRIEGDPARRAAAVKRPGFSGDLDEGSPDPFGDIPAPPLRLVSVRTVLSAPPQPSPPAAEPPGVIVLRRPLREAPFAPGQEAASPPSPPEEPIATRLRRTARDETPPPAARPHASPPPQAVPAPPPEMGANEPAPALGEDEGEPVLRAEPEPWRRSARTELNVGVGVGLVLAVVIVALAVLFRPTVDGAANMVRTDIASAPVPAPAALALGDATVRLRFGPDAGADRRAALGAAVEAAGAGDVELLSMPFEIDRARIEYFHSDDRAAAAALSRTLAPLAGALDLRDLGAVGASSEPGRIEVWLTE